MSSNASAVNRAHRRVGGLEIRTLDKIVEGLVHRRVGGLEISFSKSFDVSSLPCRRFRNLVVVASILRASSPPCRRFRKEKALA